MVPEGWSLILALLDSTPPPLLTTLPFSPPPLCAPIQPPPPRSPHPRPYPQAAAQPPHSAGAGKGRELRRQQPAHAGPWLRSHSGLHRGARANGRARRKDLRRGGRFVGMPRSFAISLVCLLTWPSHIFTLAEAGGAGEDPQGRGGGASRGGHAGRWSGGGGGARGCSSARSRGSGGRGRGSCRASSRGRLLSAVDRLFQIKMPWLFRIRPSRGW